MCRLVSVVQANLQIIGSIETKQTIRYMNWSGPACSQCYMRMY